YEFAIGKWRTSPKKYRLPGTPPLQNLYNPKCYDVGSLSGMNSRYVAKWRTSPKKYCLSGTLQMENAYKRKSYAM
ncbi:hypothetical protein J6590_102832, partial [Homalodisca vitripennis]